MIKKLPQEIATWYVIPAVRREFVEEMIRQGLSQRQAADRLGLTQAAVSNYMKDKRASQIKLNKQIQELIKASVVNILSKQSDVFQELYSVVAACEKDLTVCQIHAAYDEVPKDCDVCFHSQKKAAPAENFIQLKDLGVKP